MRSTACQRLRLESPEDSESSSGIHTLREQIGSARAARLRPAIARVQQRVLATHGSRGRGPAAMPSLSKSSERSTLVAADSKRELPARPSWSYFSRLLALWKPLRPSVPLAPSMTIYANCFGALFVKDGSSSTRAYSDLTSPPT